MRNRYGHHHMMSDEEKKKFYKKYGPRADFSKPGSKEIVDLRIELRKLREKLDKVK